jgi:hypothetical protein
MRKTILRGCYEDDKEREEVDSAVRGEKSNPDSHSNGDRTSVDSIHDGALRVRRSESAPVTDLAVETALNRTGDAKGWPEPTERRRFQRLLLLVSLA